MTQEQDAPIDPVAAGEAAAKELEALQANQNAEIIDPQGEPTPDDAPDPGADADSSADGVESSVDPASFDLTSEPEEAPELSGEIEDQINKHGKFSDHFKGKLKEKGIDAATIKMIEAGAIEAQTAGIRDFMTHAGGQEFAEVQAWAKENLSVEDRQGYQTAAQSKDEFTRHAAARDLLARYREGTKGEVTNQLDGRGPAAAPSKSVVNTPADFLTVMDDPRVGSAGAVKNTYEAERAQAAMDFADNIGAVVRANPNNTNR